MRLFSLLPNTDATCNQQGKNKLLVKPLIKRKIYILDLSGDLIALGAVLLIGCIEERGSSICAKLALLRLLPLFSCLFASSACFANLRASLTSSGTFSSCANWFIFRGLRSALGGGPRRCFLPRGSFLLSLVFEERLRA